LSVVRYGDPILQHRCKPVKRVDREIRRLMEEMFEAMEDEEGAGLAAAQVGIPLRLLVCAWEEEKYCLANPRIVHKSEETIQGHEGCLSLPNLRGEIIRPASVKVTGLDENGRPVQVVGEEMLARIFCHEIDHLNGTLFIDRVVADTLYWLVRVPSEAPGEPDEYRREPTSLEAAIERLLARRWPGAEKERRREEALAL